ncbi:MAG: xanthine dehydrogenase family protein molybdopterin-binding subunit [Planctomycetota bacterium]
MSLERRLQNAFSQLQTPTSTDLARASSSVVSDAEPSRRAFLRNTIVAGGLAVGITLCEDGSALAQNASTDQDSDSLAPTAFVNIAPDGRVKVIAMHDEMGQGTHTGLAIAVCEELEVDPSDVTVVHAPADVRYNHVAFGVQMTGGSTSMSTAMSLMRKAGATTREMLLSAAAKRWSVDRDKCRADSGHVFHSESGAKIAYGDLVAEASGLEVPDEIPLKEPKDFKRIGKATSRVDSASKVGGTAIFSLDQTVEGMLTAMVERCPYFGGKLIDFDASKALRIAGVKAVIEVSSGIAVIADGYWAAFKGRRALKVRWEPGRGVMLDSGELRTQYLELAKRKARVAESEGDCERSLQDNETLHATYEVPFQAHAPMEPLSCLVTLRDDGGADLVTGSQFLGIDRMHAAAKLGVDQEKVSIENSYLGGGFGRRANPASDFVVEAVEVAMAAKEQGIGAPMKTVWSREDDIRGGWYRPMYVNAMSASFKDGKVDGWRHRVVGQSPIKGTPFEPIIVVDGLDTWAVEGATKLPYEIPNRQVELQTVTLPVPVQWWRSVGHSNSAFAKEAFIDECAAKLGRDPLKFRQSLLGEHPRLLRVLNTVGEKAGWETPLPEGRGRGISVHESFESFAAHVVEASVENGRPRIHRIVIAVDCGPMVNPDQVVAQMEGAAIFALSAVLEGEITFKKGLIQQTNFDGFRVVRMHESPRIEVHALDSTESMGGIGEVGVPGVASAVCSAIHDACGVRIRCLPIGDQLAGV